MTMQIVLQTDEHFVLASDTKYYGTDEEAFDNDAECKLLLDGFNSTKVKFSSRHPHVAVTEACDDNLSSAISSQLLKRFDSEHPGEQELPADFQNFLRETATSLIALPKYSSEKAVLLVVNPLWKDCQIWKIRADSRQPLRPDPVRVFPITSNVIAGHENNTGIFWREYLLKKFDWPYPTQKQLEMIAATVVLSCSFLNSAGIGGIEPGGLEMWTWDGKAWIPRPEKYLKQIKEKYKQMEDGIVNIFK